MMLGLCYVATKVLIRYKRAWKATVLFRTAGDRVSANHFERSMLCLRVVLGNIVNLLTLFHVIPYPCQPEQKYYSLHIFVTQNKSYILEIFCPPLRFSITFPQILTTLR